MNKIEMQDKWVYEYIQNIDISNIEWLTLNSEELKKFFVDNYYDNKCNSYVKEFCATPIEVPIGMSYLAFNYINYDFRNLIGVVPNNIGKKTIVGCLMYLDDCYLYEEQKDPVTYILSVEVNSHFRNKGIFKKMVDEFIRNINENQHLFISNQSLMGKECKVFETVNNIAKMHSFSKKVLCNDYICNEELKKIVCNDDYTYVKKVSR